MFEQRTLSRRERERLIHRQEILDAALELFAQKGFYNVTMKEIAERAEFAVGTLYKFFQSKQHLYKSLILERTIHFHNTLINVLDEEMDDPLEQIEKFIMTKMGLLGKHIAIIRLYFTEIYRVNPTIKADLEAELTRMRREFRTKLSALMERAINAGLIRRSDPMHMAMALDGLMKGFVFGYLEESFGKDPSEIDYEKLEKLFAEDYAKTVREVFFKGALASTAA
ncbi:TetR/AcrR family transcriptional regulator [Thermodesulforhabdus norvegica]|uniref:Transcriptional regulator, TetR family n=1 Tax=Thermodesulforhabdus norvegica TaxID=39841 RepID=A0A1I4QGM5_9BACT|nr:TetR/AcrR family transcriptional regulator [Thermodesulforhabdus norvegica]SFM39164.1 transcriptional regulator, TetR family [Thermodesulforhabdus norvegica]